MKSIPLTKAFKHGKTMIAVAQCGDQFKILKKVINYVRGRNIESWRVMGSASTFGNLRDCMAKFGKLVNAQRIADGEKTINFIVED